MSVFEYIRQSAVRNAFEHQVTVNWQYQDECYRTYADGCTYQVFRRKVRGVCRTIAGRMEVKSVAPGPPCGSATE